MAVYALAPPADKLNTALTLACAGIYAFVLQALPVLAFQDRENYLAMAEQAETILRRFLAEGWHVALSNEPLWLLINIGLGSFLSPAEVVRVVIFVGAFVFSYFFLRADPKNGFWLLVFLFVPQLLKNFVVHLRQGLAMAIFFVGYFSNRRTAGSLLMVASPFVHASFFFVLLILLIPKVLREFRLASDVRITVLAIFALVTSLTLGVVAQALGARQGGDYEFQMADVSGLGFLFWSGILCLFALQGILFINRYTAEIGILVFYLISYLFLEVAARVFESGMPLVFLAGLCLTQWRRLAFVAAIVSYGTVQWFMGVL